MSIIYIRDRWQIGKKWDAVEAGHMTHRRKWHGEYNIYKGQMADCEDVGCIGKREREREKYHSYARLRVNLDAKHAVY